jgi:hypothetical protein
MWHSKLKASYSQASAKQLKMDVVYSQSQSKFTVRSRNLGQDLAIAVKVQVYS